MKTTTISIICVLTIAYAATAYELPEVICEFSRPNIEFGNYFVNLGDQNGDGCDDILLSNSGLERSELYFGGREMDDEPDLLFEPRQQGNDLLNLGAFYLQRLTPEGSHYFITSRLSRNNRAYELELYEGGEHLGEEPVYILRGVYDSSAHMLQRNKRVRPADFNGDGFDDLITAKEGNPASLEIFFGGEEFDTIPDWVMHYEEQGEHNIRLLKWSSGYDINNDGCDDLMLKGNGYRIREGEEVWDRYYSILLGGSPMDTIPVLQIWSEHFPGAGRDPLSILSMDHNFTLLPDVNGDGYDDWGFWWHDTWEGWEDDGFFIFFGGEELDFEPDLSLDGHRRLWVNFGDLTGGDFNGDGYGDVACTVWCGNPAMSELLIHFGGRWMDEETDIYVNLASWNECNIGMIADIGAPGDYNGDGIDDFGACCWDGDVHFALFAGSEDWVVSAEEPQVLSEYNLELSASPNPFNSEVNFSFTLNRSSHITLNVYDLRGRLIERLIDGWTSRGEKNLTWRNNSAGVYFARLEAGGVSLTKKVVCLP